MKNVRGLLLGVLAGVALTIPALADPSPTPNAPEATSAAIATPDDAVLSAVRGKLASQPAATDERERDDQTALTDFYTARHGEGLWVTASGLKPEAKLLASEIANAWAYALDVSAFKLPKLENGMLTTNDTDSLADAEIQYSTAALLYARHARGGRIPDPTSMLTTEFDRRPQWIAPKAVIEASRRNPRARRLSARPRTATSPVRKIAAALRGDASRRRQTGAA